MVGDSMFALFMVITPIAVLRARTILGQFMALVLSMAIYAAAYVYALSSFSGLSQPHFHLSVSQSISIARPIIYLFVAVVLAMPVYVAIFKGYFTARKSAYDAASQHP